jgi:two-component system, LytTR family, sensor kinase
MKLYRKAFDSEITIYFIIWLFVLAEPILISLGRSENFSVFLVFDWVRDIPIFILFIINTLWLIPNFLFNKKFIIYLCLIILFCFASTVIGELLFAGVKDFSHKPPPGFHQHLPPPHMQGIDPEMPPHMGMFDFGFLTQIIIDLLIVSLNTAIKMTIKWYKDEQTQREKEKEYLKSELTFLQGQVSPHFFMNTLNNIHALIDINGKDAQLVVVKLSKMMRYLLYESDDENSTIKKEIEFLENYIDLMKLRIDKTVNIKYSVPNNYNDIKMPPLLLIPFIENAFKHGISYQENSFINITFELDKNSIIFNCINSMVTQNLPLFSHKGIGLANVKKRLNLLYGKAYELEINETISEFHVRLIIPMYED